MIWNNWVKSWKRRQQLKRLRKSVDNKSATKNYAYFKEFCEFFVFVPFCMNWLIKYELLINQFIIHQQTYFIKKKQCIPATNQTVRKQFEISAILLFASRFEISPQMPLTIRWTGIQGSKGQSFLYTNPVENILIW